MKLDGYFINENARKSKKGHFVSSVVRLLREIIFNVFQFRGLGTSKLKIKNLLTS